MNKQLRGRLSKYLSKLRVSIDLHDDIIHDSWIRMNRATNILDYEKYAFTTVRNQAFNLNKKRNRSVSLSSTPELSYENTQLEARSTYKQLYTLLKLLPSKQEQAVRGYYLEEKSFKELAKELNMKYDTVKANSRHGLLRLRQIFKEQV